MEENFGRDTYRSGYAAAPLISSTPVSHNHPLYRPCRIRQDDFCSSTKIAARYTIPLQQPAFPLCACSMIASAGSTFRWRAESPRELTATCVIGSNSLRQAYESSGRSRHKNSHRMDNPVYSGEFLIFFEGRQQIPKCSIEQAEE